MAGRAAPMTPEDFAAELELKSFTSKKADLPTVGALYTAAYTKRFAAATGLFYAQLGWGDAEVISLSRVLESGALDHLTVCWRPTALSPCLETPHVHSPDSEHLFDVPYAVA